VLQFLAYPIVNTKAFEAFPCYNFDEDGRWLEVDVLVKCDSPEYSRILMWAWLAIAIYPIAWTVTTAVLLYLARKPITSQPSDDAYVLYSKKTRKELSKDTAFAEASPEEQTSKRREMWLSRQASSEDEKSRFKAKADGTEANAQALAPALSFIYKDYHATLSAFWWEGTRGELELGTS